VFKCIRGGFCIEFPCENGGNHLADKIQTLTDVHHFGKFFGQPFGENTFSKNAPPEQPTLNIAIPLNITEYEFCIGVSVYLVCLYQAEVSCCTCMYY